MRTYSIQPKFQSILLQNAKPSEDHLRTPPAFSHSKMEIESTTDAHWTRMDIGAQQVLICLEDMSEERRIGAYAASVAQNKVSPANEFRFSKS